MQRKMEDEPAQDDMVIGLGNAELKHEIDAVWLAVAGWLHILALLQWNQRLRHFCRAACEVNDD